MTKRLAILSLVAGLVIAAGATQRWLRRPAPGIPASTPATSAGPARPVAAPAAIPPVTPGHESAAVPQHPHAPLDTNDATRQQKIIQSMVRDLRRDYADLDDEAGLNEAERDAVLQLLAEYRLHSMKVELATAADGRTGALALEELERQRQSDLRQLVGRQRSALVLRFEDTVPVRMETRLVAELLADSPWPMSQDQSRRLTRGALDAFAREAVARPDAGHPDPASQEEADRVDPADATLLNVARDVLDAEQYAVYERFIKQRYLLRGDIE